MFLLSYILRSGGPVEKGNHIKEIKDVMTDFHLKNVVIVILCSR